MAGNVFQTKQAARKAFEAVRRSLSSQQVSDWGGEVLKHLTALAFWAPARTVALYAAQSFEVPTAPLAESLQARGVATAYPRVVKGERVLTFHRQMSGQALVETGPLRLLEPAPGWPLVPTEAVDVWVVPGVAFTRRGGRLGRGGGYYDATLARRRPDSVTVGVAFDCCVAERLPLEAHDVTVDWLVTERGSVRCSPDR